MKTIDLLVSILFLTILIGLVGASWYRFDYIDFPTKALFSLSLCLVLDAILAFFTNKNNILFVKKCLIIISLFAVFVLSFQSQMELFYLLFGVTTVKTATLF